MAVTTTLKPAQRKVIEQDLATAEDQLVNPNIAPFIQDKGALQKQVRHMKKTLEEQAPQPYATGVEKDAAAARSRELSDGFTLNMPSRQEMNKNRDGSVYRHMKWEKQFKSDILEWREIEKRLNHDSDDPDLTSYERFRKERPDGYDTTAQIPGVHVMSLQAKENWPEDMAQPTATTAVSHLKEFMVETKEKIVDAGEKVKDLFVKAPDASPDGTEQEKL